MEKYFVPWYIADSLRIKGFNEPCMAFWRLPDPLLQMVSDEAQYRVTGWQTVKNSEIKSPCLAAPLYDQVFDWLEEMKIRIHDVYIITDMARGWHSALYNMENGKQLWPAHPFTRGVKYDTTDDKRLCWDNAINEALKLLK